MLFQVLMQTMMEEALEKARRVHQQQGDRVQSSQAELQQAVDHAALSRRARALKVSVQVRGYPRTPESNCFKFSCNHLIVQYLFSVLVKQ